MIMSVKNEVNEKTLELYKSKAVSLGKPSSGINLETKIEDDLGFNEGQRRDMATELTVLSKSKWGGEVSRNDAGNAEKIEGAALLVYESIARNRVLEIYKDVAYREYGISKENVTPESKIGDDLGFSSETKQMMSSPLSQVSAQLGGRPVTREKAGSFSKVKDAQDHVWGLVK